jgi:hypothetical protein
MGSVSNTIVKEIHYKCHFIDQPLIVVFSGGSVHLLEWKATPNIRSVPLGGKGAVIQFLKQTWKVCHILYYIYILTASVV